MLYANDNEADNPVYKLILQQIVDEINYINPIYNKAIDFLCSIEGPKKDRTD